jgi:hypothetical protein
LFEYAFGAELLAESWFDCKRNIERLVARSSTRRVADKLLALFFPGPRLPAPIGFDREEACRSTCRSNERGKWKGFGW